MDRLSRFDRGPSETAGPRSTSLGACDFLTPPCSLWPESSEDQLPIIIAGVLRLRATSPLLSNRPARRFAQDDGFVEGSKNIWSSAKNTKRSKKSQALGMTKFKIGLGPWGWLFGWRVLESGCDREGTVGPSTARRDRSATLRYGSVRLSA